MKVEEKRKEGKEIERGWLEGCNNGEKMEIERRMCE